MSEPVEPEGLTCARCGRSVEASKDHYEVFERMHYTCFHYEFEHPGDPDVECFGGGCPAAGLGFPSLRFRIEGVELAQAGNTVVPQSLPCARSVLPFRKWARISLRSWATRDSKPRIQCPRWDS